MGMILMFDRGLHRWARQQMKREWNRNGFENEVGELYGATLGIIGLGDIGEALAYRAKCFGMRVLATRRHPEKSSDAVDTMLSSEQIDHLLGESDFIAVCAPLTAETRGMIGEKQFRMMKPDAIIINIARGAIIDQDALIRALQEGRIGGAGLDVTVPEPLPPDNPLWGMPNVIISPHIAGLNPHYGTRAADIFVRNLHAFLRGDIQSMPTLVDRSRGY
jgi:phosphoglycerate dehydrogenase-like enzyme